MYFFPESSLDLVGFDDIMRAEVVEEQILPRHIRVKVWDNIIWFIAERGVVGLILFLKIDYIY